MSYVLDILLSDGYLSGDAEDTTGLVDCDANFIKPSSTKFSSIRSRVKLIHINTFFFTFISYN